MGGGEEKSSSRKRNSGVDYSGKKGSMSTLSNYEFSQNRSYFLIFLSSVLCIVWYIPDSQSEGI